MLLDMPYQVHDTLEQVRDGQVEVGFRHEGLDELFHRIDLVFNRLVVAMIAVGGILGSSLIGVFVEDGPAIVGVNVFAVLGFTLSTVLAIWLIWSVVRSGRL